MPPAMVNLFLSLAVATGLALLWGAWRLWKSKGPDQKVWLMIVAALVLFANVAIWTVPDEQGQTLAEATK
jgi:drug/metabolite transporter superfamily protein YnfA